MVSQKMLEGMHAVWISLHSIIVRSMSSPDESDEEVEDVAATLMRNRRLPSHRVISAVQKSPTSASVRFMALKLKPAVLLAAN
jgi:hypothetical protein